MRFCRPILTRRQVLGSLAGLAATGTAGWQVLRWREHSFREAEHAKAVAAGSRLPAAAAGWPRLLGPSGQSTSAETGLNLEWPDSGPPRAWEYALGPGYSAPVVNDDGLIVFYRRADEERIECLDPESGTRRWTRSYLTTYKCKFEYSSGPYSTPAIDGDRVFALSAQGTLRCCEMRNGQVIWQRDLSREYEIPEGLFGVGHGPCVAGSQLILNAGGAKHHAGIVALDRLTGKTLWSATDHEASYATPVVAAIHGLRHALVFTAKGLVSLDPESGRVRWVVPFGVESAPDRANAVSPLVYGDLVLLSAGPGPGNLCLRILPDGHWVEVWKSRRAMDSQFNNQIVTDGYAYGFTSLWNRSASLVCLDLLSGKVRWQWNSDLVRGSGLAADRRLILLGEHGLLAALDLNPDRPVVRSLTAAPLLEKPCYSAPALHRGLLYIRDEKRLLCLNLRRPSAAAR